MEKTIENLTKAFIGESQARNRYTFYAKIAKKEGFDIDALIGIDTEPEYYISTLERLKQTKEVIGLCSSSGDHMILAECWFKNSNELAKFIKKLEKSKGIIKICPAIILEKIK